MMAVRMTITRPLQGFVDAVPQTPTLIVMVLPTVMISVRMTVTRRLLVSVVAVPQKPTLMVMVLPTVGIHVLAVLKQIVTPTPSPIVATHAIA